MRIFSISWLFLGLTSGLGSGCGNANVPLNNPRRPLGNPLKNDSRSAVYAGVQMPRTSESASHLITPNTIVPSYLARALPKNHDKCFVGLALSGGGSRSANFSAACMFELERTGLLKYVDYISSVSGGSVTAAYYCSSDKWNIADAHLKLGHAFATDLICKCLLPWNLVAFAFTDWDRSDLLANDFEQILFTRNGKPLTYADLRPDRPRLLINATDLQSGRRFVFCNESFDTLNSNLSAYPLGYAVAASAAIPVLLHPVTLRDYSTLFPQYRHMIDGGITDNLGIQTLIETYSAQLESAARCGNPDPYPNGAVFVVISAATRYDTNISDSSDVGLLTSLTAPAGLSITALLNRSNSATLAETIVNNAPDGETAAAMRARIRQLDIEGFVRLKDNRGHSVRVLYMALSQLDGLSNVPGEHFTESINNIATFFDIDASETDSLYLAADLLMKNKLEPYVREVVADLKAGHDTATTKPASILLRP
jgi:predicted acylesterase/phospholipase RssA